MGKENLTHVLREYQLTRSNMQEKEFLNEEGGLELIEEDGAAKKEQGR